MAMIWRKIGLVTMMAAVCVLTAQAAPARESGIQRTPDNARVLVSKDVDGQRYAITFNTDDRTATGNVFSADGSAPQFLSCAPVGTGPSAFTCRVADTCDSSAGRESGIQQAFASQAVLVSKDVEGQRYAITKNTDGTLTGNVFFSATGAAKFLYCTPAGAAYTCAVADSCTTLPCTSQFVTLPDPVTLPATFFTLPDSCRTYGDGIAVTLPRNFFVPDLEVMSAATRQAVVNNPFRSTQIGTDDQLAKGAAINDIIFANRIPNGPAKVGDTAQCPAGGQQRLEKCETLSLDTGPAMFSTITLDNCTVGSPFDGFIVQNGTLQILIQNATICILVTPFELPIGFEILEQRQNFETTFFNGPGLPTEIDLENSTGSVTHLDACSGVDPRFASNLRRDVVETLRIETMNPPGIGDPKSVVQQYDGVSIRREYSADCSTRVTTISSGLSGDLSTVDDRFGESYATRFDALQYALSGPNDSTSLSIDGRLLDVCTEISGDRSGNRVFAYRTITPASFNRDGDGCPRGGAFELSAEGVVIGQLSFTDAGGVTLTPVSGAPFTFASCNDPALLLKTCAANNQM